MLGVRGTRGLTALPALALLLCATPTRAAVSFTASVSPSAIRSPAKLEHRLKMVNHTDTEQRFSVTISQPTYGPSRPGYGHAEMASVTERGTPTIDPPATSATHLVRTFIADTASCSSTGVGDHGYQMTSYQLGVALPPRTTSRVRARYMTSRPLWQDLDLRLRFEIGPKLASGAPGTPKRSRIVRSPSPRVTGRRAAHIMFRTMPSGTVVIRPGTRVGINGLMVPAIAGQRIDFRYARISASGRVSKTAPAAVAYVRAFGAFRTTGNPPNPATTSCGRDTPTTAPACSPTTRVRRCSGSPLARP